jgi:Flp pilus assembly protein TadD
MHFLFSLIPLLPFFFNPVPALQGPGGASPKAPDQAIAIEEILTKYTYQSDGTGVRTNEVRARVLSPAGVQALGQLAFGYNSDNEALVIDYVRVRKPSGEVISTAVDKAPEVSIFISDSAPVYTDYREKHVPVAGLAPGDTLEYKITVNVTAPLAPNQFWMSHSFNKISEVKDERLILEVPLNSKILLKSSKYQYTQAQVADTRTYTWQSTHEGMKQEPKKQKDSANEDQNNAADVQVSTFQQWQEVAKWYADLQRSKDTVTDAVSEKTLEITKGATTEEEKARRLYDYVSKNIRYVSLSFGVGRYQPHSAAEVLHNQYGDCKDKHTLLSAMLKTVGIESHPLLIHSSVDLDPDIPSPSQFNHVITAAEVGGKRVWLDTTTEIAPFGLLIPALRGKQALLGTPELSNPIVETPAIAPLTSKQLFEAEGEFNDAGDLEANFKIAAEGDAALLLRIAARGTAQNQWTELIQNFSYLSGFAGDVSNVKIENVETVEKPLNVSYHYSRKSYFAVDDRDSSIGRNTLPMPQVAVDPSRIASLKKRAGFQLGGPLEFTQKIKLTFPKMQQPKMPIPVSISRDYGTYKSKYTLEDGVFIAERILSLNLPFLPAAREKDLDNFLAAINQDRDQQLSVKVLAYRASSADENTSDPEKLNNAAFARLDAMDYSGAAKLAERAVTLDPHSLSAWNNLGRSYLGLRQPDKAEAAFRKQIEVNPYDQYAYNNLGLALRDQNRNEEAITSFRKQIELVPLDKWAHKNLGDLLLTLNKSIDAVPELEIASQITPDDMEVSALLADAYSKSGNQDKANALIPTLMAKRSTVASGLLRDPYSAPFSETGDPKEALYSAIAGLDKLEQVIQENDEPESVAGFTSIISVSWARVGWSHLRMGQIDEAEQYLKAAWETSQSSSIGTHLGEVYEKEGKKALAAQTYAEAMAAGGDKEEIQKRLATLVTDESKLKSMIAKAGGDLSQRRTVILNKIAQKPKSTSVFLVFVSGQQPSEVVFPAGETAFTDQYEKILKQQKFPTYFPDGHTQHIIREGTLYCGVVGCSVVLMLPSWPSFGVEAAPQ